MWKGLIGRDRPWGTVIHLVDLPLQRELVEIDKSARVVAFVQNVGD